MGSKRRKIAPIPEESCSPRIIATLLTPSSTPARGGKDILPHLPLPISMVLARQDAASVSESESAATKSSEPLASSSSQSAAQAVTQTSSKPPRHVRREQSCCDSTIVDSSILDSSLLGGHTVRDSMVSEGPLATDASFARQAFDYDISEDMLGAHSVADGIYDLRGPQEELAVEATFQCQESHPAWKKQELFCNLKR